MDDYSGGEVLMWFFLMYGGILAAGCLYLKAKELIFGRSRRVPFRDSWDIFDDRNA